MGNLYGMFLVYLIGNVMFKGFFFDFVVLVKFDNICILGVCVIDCVEFECFI